MTLSLFLMLTLMGAVNAYLAYQRGRDPYIWFALGMVLGLLGLLVLLLLPRVENNVPPSERSEEVKPVQLLLPQEQDKDTLFTHSWYFLDESAQQHGPLTFDALKEAWENETIDAATFVWREGMEGWKRIYDIPELEEILTTT